MNPRAVFRPAVPVLLALVLGCQLSGETEGPPTQRDESEEPSSGRDDFSSPAGDGATGGDTYFDYPEPAETYVQTPFFDDFDGSAVDTSKWQVATWVEHGGQTGAERCYVEDGNLKMIFVNDSSQGYLSSAIQTRDEYYFGRWETRLKPSNVPGVLNSMFTIDWENTVAPGTGDGTKQEIDIEFLTYAFTGTDGKVHFALHAAGHPSTDTNPDIELGFDPSADFHIWGFDISPEKIDWFVDDQVLMTIHYSENAISIDAPYQLKFNFWSQTKWINGPPAPDVECVYLIDWVRFTPYTNGN